MIFTGLGTSPQVEKRDAAHLSLDGTGSESAPATQPHNSRAHNVHTGGRPAGASVHSQRSRHIEGGSSWCRAARCRGSPLRCPSGRRSGARCRASGCASAARTGTRSFHCAAKLPFRVKPWPGVRRCRPASRCARPAVNPTGSKPSSASFPRPALRLGWRTVGRLDGTRCRAPRWGRDTEDSASKCWRRHPAAARASHRARTVSAALRCHRVDPTARREHRRARQGAGCSERCRAIVRS